MAEPFRPTLFSPPSASPPPRITTDPQPTPAKKSHLHSLHHHPRRHHHSHHGHSSRHHAKEAVQSAIQLHPPTSFGDLLKQAKGSASASRESTPAHSRRESRQIGVNSNAEVERKRAELEKPVRPEDVEREQRRGKCREEELRSSLQELSDQSLKTSRRLDDTYYSILEKVSLLRQTIGSLQELSGLTKELHDNFRSDTKELAEEIKGQFEGFNNFEAQQEQVTKLEARMKAGKEKADVLNIRLAEARKRVEARARSEAEWEARTTRRLRMLWGTLASIVGLILILTLFQQLRPPHSGQEHKAGLDFSSRANILDAPIPDIAKEAIMSPRSSPAVCIETPVVKPVEELEDDPRLHIFDEL